MKRLAALLLCLCLLPGSLAFAAEDGQAVRIYEGALLRLRGFREADVLYLSPALLCRRFGLEAEEAIDEDGYTLSVPEANWRFEAPTDAEVYTADGRLLYCPEGSRLFEGRVCFPAELVGRLFGLVFRFDGERAEMDGSGFQLLRGGADYYSRRFSADDLYWLCHIIHSEARWEPLAGKIGVGNVVLNRVKSPQFPDTIMAVVLERSHVVQFSPVESGEVAAEPEAEAQLAARLCLEGYNTVGESLYFVNPERGDDTWFREALTPTVTIGLHHFYK